MIAMAATPTSTRRRWSTPRLLHAGRVALISLEVLLFASIFQSTRLHREAMQTVGKDAAPSIVAAQGIRTAISGMDAELAAELLTPPRDEFAALRSFNAERDQAAVSLVTAAENITYGEEERRPIRTLQSSLAVYESLAQETRDLHEEHSPAALDTYRQAEALVDQSLLPAAGALDAANFAVLDRTYRHEAVEAAAARSFVVLLGLVTVAGLVGMQVFLSRRTRRTFNLMLLAATVLTVWLTAHGASAMGREQEQLRVAKEDAFDSVSALWRARAVAYEAEGNENRFLADPARADTAQRDFTAETNALARIPAGLTPDQLVAAVRNDPRVEGFTGYIADELHNITFPGERDAALSTLSRLEDYLNRDAAVRQFERTGQTGRAVDLCLGASPGGAAGAFSQFDQALGTTLAINQREFESAVAKGMDALHGLEIEGAVTLLLAAVLIFLGFSARIREYL